MQIIPPAFHKKPSVWTRRTFRARIKDEDGGGGDGCTNRTKKEGIGSMCDRVKNNNPGPGIQADRSADTRLDMADWCLSAPCPPVDASCARMSCRNASCRRTRFRDDTSSYIFGGKCLGFWQGKCCEAHEDPAGNRNDIVCLFVCLFVHMSVYSLQGRGIDSPQERKCASGTRAHSALPLPCLAPLS